MENQNSNLTFIAKYHRTTAKGTNLFTVHGTEEELNTYVNSILKAGRNPSYLTARDQVTPLLDTETGLKIPLAFDSLSYVIDEFFDYEFPMVLNTKGQYNPELTVCAHAEEILNRFPNRDIVWCISQATKKLQRERAQQLQDVSAVSITSAPEATETTEEPAVNVSDIAQKIASASKKKTKKS